MRKVLLICWLLCFAAPLTMQAQTKVYNGVRCDVSGTTVIFSGHGEINHELRIGMSQWYEFVKNIVIKEGITSIGTLAFKSCVNLTSITIPNSVTTIGEHAFSGCSNLTSVAIPNSVTPIGDFAFSSCRNMSITIPRSVTIGVCAFDQVKEIKRVLTDNGVNYILAEENRKYGLESADGREIVPTELDALEQCGKGYLRYKLNGFWGVMNYAGNIIIDTDRGYTSIGDFKTFNKRFAYTMKGYKGECDVTGRQISKIKVDTPQQTVASSSSSSLSSSDSSSSSSGSSNSNSGNNSTTIHVEHHHDPVPVQEWVQCTACWESGTCPDCAGSGTRYVGDNLRRCWRCGGRGKCSSCSVQGGRYYTVYK